MKLSILIPVFNEEKSIKEIVKKVLKEKSVGEIIIINDGSSDKTQEIITKIAENKTNIKIVSHTTNQGKGSAIITGLKYVTLNYILIQDADLEYNPSEYQKLTRYATENVVVYGSRLKTNNKHAYTRTYFGNILVTTLFNLFFGTKLTDSYTCYKLIPSKIAKSLNLKSSGFEIEAEITAKIAKRKIPIIEIPISYSPRKYEEGKKIKAIDAIKGIITLIKVRFV